MADLIWINGEIIPFCEARIGVEDRGFQFADGVYEVIRIYGGLPFTIREHLDRLERSCRAIYLPPADRLAIEQAVTALIDRSGLMDAMAYLQITRGVSPRNHVIPDDIAPTILGYLRPLPCAPVPGEGPGIRLITTPDERWKRCWIKSIALLPNALAKSQAVAAGADEAVFVDDGIVNECSASNLFAVIGEKLLTHPVGPKVLPGITRALVLELAAAMGIEAEERPIREEEAAGADELFITSTTRELAWVRQWDHQPIGTGGCGMMTLALHQAYQQRIAATLGHHPCPPLVSTDHCPLPMAGKSH